MACHDLNDRLKYAVFVTRNILVIAKEMSPGEVCSLIGADAELPIGLVYSLIKCSSVKCHRLNYRILYLPGCKVFGSGCAETADVADPGQTCPVLSLPETASHFPTVNLYDVCICIWDHTVAYHFSGLSQYYSSWLLCFVSLRKTKVVPG